MVRELSRVGLRVHCGLEAGKSVWQRHDQRRRKNPFPEVMWVGNSADEVNVKTE